MTTSPPGHRLHWTSPFALLICAGLISGCGRAGGGKAAVSSSMLPDGPPSGFFEALPIGERPTAGERPRMAHVQIADLDSDGLPDVLACDALRNRVELDPAVAARDVHRGDDRRRSRRRRTSTAIDFDGDGDLDLVVAALGVLMPSNNRVGSVVAPRKRRSPAVHAPRARRADRPRRGRRGRRSRRRRRSRSSPSPASATTMVRPAGWRTRAAGDSSSMSCCACRGRSTRSSPTSTTTAGPTSSRWSARSGRRSGRS